MTKDELIKILWDEILVANSREALDGYFDHLTNDAEITALIDGI